MFDPKLVGQRLKSLRAEHGCKQDEIAKALGMRQSSVSGQERGDNLPTPQALYWYAQRYGVTVDYILGLTDIPASYVRDEKDCPDEGQSMMNVSAAELLQHPERFEKYVFGLVQKALQAHESKDQD